MPDIPSVHHEVGLGSGIGHSRKEWFGLEVPSANRFGWIDAWRPCLTETAHRHSQCTKGVLYRTLEDVGDREKPRFSEG